MALASAVMKMSPPKFLRDDSQAARLWAHLHTLPAIDGRVYFAARDVAPYANMTPTSVLSAVAAWERTGNVHVIRETASRGGQQRVRGMMSPSIEQKGSQTDRVLQVLRAYADDRGKVNLGPEEIQRRAGLRDYHDVNKAFHNLRELGVVNFDARNIGNNAERVTNIRLRDTARVPVTGKKAEPPEPLVKPKEDALDKRIRQHLGTTHAVSDWQTTPQPWTVHSLLHEDARVTHDRGDLSATVAEQKPPVEPEQQPKAEPVEPKAEPPVEPEQQPKAEPPVEPSRRPSSRPPGEQAATALRAGYPLVAALLERAGKVEKVEAAARLLEQADMPDAAIRVLEEGGSFNPLEAEVVRLVKEQLP